MPPYLSLRGCKTQVYVAASLTEILIGLMNRLIRYFLPFLGVVAAALPVHAQRITSPYKFIDSSQELGGFAAHVNADKGAAGLGSESGMAYGARYGLRFSGPLMVDVGVMYFPT